MLEKNLKTTRLSLQASFVVAPLPDEWETTKQACRENM